MKIFGYNLKNILVYVSILTTFASCKQVECNKYIDQLNIDHLGVEKQEWDIELLNVDEREYFCRLIAQKNNSVFHLEFMYSYKQNKLYLLNLREIIKSDHLLTIIQHHYSDTLYVYTIPKYAYDDIEKSNNTEYMHFSKGKYYYQYQSNMLSNQQANFYEQHKDSLNKVTGNDLPDLPMW